MGQTKNKRCDTGYKARCVSHFGGLHTCFVYFLLLAIFLSSSNVSAYTYYDADTGWLNNNQNMLFGGNMSTLGNVGIGTTSPLTNLHVSTANSNVALFERISNQNATVAMKNTLGTAYFGINPSGNAALGLTADLSNAPIQIKSTGYVGIGTTAPAYKFVVSNAGAMGLEVDPTGTAFPGGVGIAAYDRVGAAYKDIGIGAGFNQMVLKASGNVGIGTTTPGDKLEVSGNVFATAFNAIGSVARYNTTGGTFISGNAGSAYGGIQAYSDGSGTAKSLALNQNGGNVGIGTTTPTGKLDVYGPYADVSLSANASATANFRTGGHVQMSINTQLASPYTTSLQAKHSVSDGNAYPIALNPLGGNVGIGTTTPGAKLEVAGALQISGSTGFNATSSISSPAIVGAIGSPNAGEIRFGDATGWKFNFAKASDSGATKFVTFQDNGNVGIGTTTPGTKLEVAGQVKITGGTPGAGKVLTSDAAGLATWQTPTAASETDPKVGTLTTNYIPKWNGSTLANANILDDGTNVGIGTTTPRGKLDVNGRNSYVGTIPVAMGYAGNGYPGIGYNFAGQADGSWKYQSGDTAYMIGLGQGNMFSFNYASAGVGGNAITWTNAMSILNNGNVGIGDTSPTQKLVVAGSAVVTGGILGGETGAPDSTIWGVSGDYQNWGLYYNEGAPDRIEFRTAGSANTAIALDTGDSYINSLGGNLGVGTASPGYKLDVQGDIYANGWLRSAGTTGWYNQTYGGGWYMADSSWIRTYNGKGIYQDTGIIRTDGTLQVGPSGGTLNVDSGGNLNYRSGVLFANTAGNVGIGTASPGQKLDVAGNLKLDDNIMVEGNGNYRLYRNLASYSLNSSAAAGAFVIDTNQPWNSPCMFRMKVSGYFYDGTAPFDITLGGYMYTSNNFVNTGYVNVGAKKLSVRYARNISKNTIAVILGNEGATYSYPKMTVNEFAQSYSSISETYADGWTLTQQSSLAAYDNIQGVADATTVDYAGTAGTANSVAWANVTGKPNLSANNFQWNWSGQAGQPSWLWGGSDGTNMYVYNPSNFSVNYANSAGGADTLDGLHAGSFLRKDTADSLGGGVSMGFNGGSTFGIGVGANKHSIWVDTLESPASDGTLELAYYTAANISLNNGGGYTYNGTSMRSPIFYDQNNTGYYVDPASTSVMNSICAGGNCGSYLTHDGTYLRAQGNFRTTGTFYNDGTAYSTIFYDANDSSYYSDPASTSRLNTLSMAGNITINNGSPTIYLQDSDQNSAMIHTNSNLFYILRGGVNTTSWSVVGNDWPFYLNLTDNNAFFGANVNAYGFFYRSDERLKKNIGAIDSPLEMIKKLKGHTFTWKNTEKKDIGFIAQEVEKVYPDLVGEAKDAKGVAYKTVEYGNLVAPVVEAIKELSNKVDELFAKYLDQQKEIDTLQSESQNLQKQINELKTAIKK